MSYDQHSQQEYDSCEHGSDSNCCCCRLEQLHEDLQEQDAHIAELEKALQASLKLQSHYATILNGHDGGMRQTFVDIDAWIQRLQALKVTP